MENDRLLDKLVIEEIKTQSDYLAERIKGMIVSGELEDGFTFPNENEFCKRLGVSRSTLREAYKILDTWGFIRRTKHGTYIRNRTEIAKQGNFSASLQLAEKQELEEFVCALEPEAVYLAALKADAESFEKLEKLMLGCEAASDAPKAVVETNYRFHAYIRELAGNNLIISALSAYYDAFNHQVIETIYARKNIDEFKQNSIKEHRQIFQAMKDKNADKAKELARRHLLASIEFERMF